VEVDACMLELCAPGGRLEEEPDGDEDEKKAE